MVLEQSRLGKWVVFCYKPHDMTEKQEQQIDVHALQDQLANAEERALRAAADLQNYKRREDEAKAMWSYMAISGFVTPLLGRISELQKGIEHDPESALAQVVQAFLADVTKGGLKPIVPVAGEKINPNMHEVLMQADSGEPGTVAQLLEAGWQFGERVLAPAKVSAVPE